MDMPLGRYFCSMGSLLLALLFLADWYLPQLAVTPARADVDRTVIRLRSLHKWPERIVIDTNLPTIVPPPTRTADILPAHVPPAVRPPREALALAMPEQNVVPTIAPKPVPRRRTRVTREHGRSFGYETIGLRDASAGW